MASKFNTTLQDAIADISKYGYDSIARIDLWKTRIRDSLQSTQANIEQKKADEKVSEKLKVEYEKTLKKQKVASFTLHQISPELHNELYRRQKASLDLIRLNREEAIEKTLRSFEGFATSVPQGGSSAINRRQQASDIGKHYRNLSFIERRVSIDQAHKLASNVNRIVADAGGAIAAIWHSHWRQVNYNYRKDHKERDENIYTIRGNWAQEEGLMKVGRSGYLDSITQPAEEPFCRCYAEYIYSIRDLPEDMLTKKGKKAAGLTNE